MKDRSAKRGDVVALAMLAGMAQAFPQPFGGTRVAMRVPEIGLIIMPPKFKRRKLEGKKKRIHQSRVLVNGGNYRQNAKKYMPYHQMKVNIFDMPF